jgi:hypothetical protein
VLESCDDVDGDREQSAQETHVQESHTPENETLTTMRPLSEEPYWHPRNNGGPEILTTEHVSPGAAQSHSNETSPQQQITMGHALSLSPPKVDGPPSLPLREASLMRNFILKIAPWVSDSLCMRAGRILT